MLRVRQLGRKWKKCNGMKNGMSTTTIETRLEIKEGYGCEEI